jgi:hypothetical protein
MLFLLAVAAAVVHAVLGVGDQNSVNNAADAALIRSWRSALPEEMTKHIEKDLVSVESA